MLGAAKVNEFCSKPFYQANFSAALEMMADIFNRLCEAQEVTMPIFQNTEYRTRNIEWPGRSSNFDHF
jgi:hypothetical protein